jgi:FixJ family two-component response regulator
MITRSDEDSKQQRLVLTLVNWSMNSYDLADLLGVHVRTVDLYRAELRTRHNLPDPPRGKLRREVCRMCLD